MAPSHLQLALRNLIFVILQPGIVAGLIPYLIAKNDFSNAIGNAFLLYHYFGILIFVIGLFIMIHCVIRFIMDGLGTISPADPTKRLVTSGLYKISRNPMYAGVMLILTGEVIFTRSHYLLIYTLVIFVLFHVFIAYREEPRLKKDFSKEYEEYYRTVKRWI